MTYMEGSRADELLALVARAVRRTTTDGTAGEDTLHALTALHDLRDLLQAWEPRLIEAAREQGVSWSRLAPALGVTSRQAAERRYLRMRGDGDDALTREERVQATRDERAGDRAVAAWARDNAAELRQIAGQVSGAAGLSQAGRRRARTLASSLTGDDPTDLLAPLADMHRDLVEEHLHLADRVGEVSRRVSKVRSDTQRRRERSAQS